MKRFFFGLILSICLLLPLATMAQTYESVPYFTSFEGLNYLTLPPGWENFETYTHYSEQYPGALTGMTVHSGDAVLYMRSSGGTNLTATCLFDSLPWLKIEFYARIGIGPDLFEVGVMEDSTFVPIDTLELVPSVYTRYRVYFNEYSGIGSRIAFRTQGTSNYGVLIDDVSVEVAPTCRAEPGVPEITPGATDATLVWAPASSSSQYGVFLNDTVYSTNDTSLTIPDLMPNSNYSGYLFNICPAGDTSELVSFSFRTSCAAISSLPYRQDFESEVIQVFTDTNAFVFCWYRFSDGTTGGGYPNYPWVASGPDVNHTPGGSKGLRWFNPSNGGNSRGSYRCIALPPMDSTIDINTTRLTFWARAQSPTCSPKVIVGMMSVPGDITTFDPVDTVEVSGTRWRRYEALMTDYTGNGTYVAIRANNSPDAWDMYLDDVVLDYIPTCSHLNSITFDPTIRQGGSYLALTWDSTGAASYEVQYGTENFELGTGTSITTLTNSITLSGLDSLTSYDVYVRQVCAAGDTSEWIWGTFATLLCDNTNITYSADTSIIFHGDRSIDFYANYNLCETIISSTSLGGPQVISAVGFYQNFYLASTAKTNCTIYLQPYRPTPLQPYLSSFIPLDTNAVCVYTGPLNGVQGWNTFIFDTPYNYDGSSDLMMIIDDNSNAYERIGSFGFSSTFGRGNNTACAASNTYDIDPTDPSGFTGYVQVSSICPIMQLISCGGQFCVVPTITSIATSTNGATINWVGNSDSYEIAYWAEGDYDFCPAVVVTGNSYTFTGLLPETYHGFRVRQRCSDDSSNYSDWTDITFFTDPYPCDTPTDISVSNITKTDATIGWTINGREHDWEVHIWADSLSDQIIANTSNSIAVNELVPGATYNVAVRALCGRFLREGEWSDTVTFTTRLCPDVEGLIVSNITDTTVDLSWDADPLAVYWELLYDLTGTNQEYDTIRLTTNSYSATGLAPGHTYHFYVRAVCNADWPSDNWKHAYVTTNNHSCILTAEDDGDIAVYPNPCSDHINLYSSTEQITSITLYDMAGRQVLHNGNVGTPKNGAADQEPYYTLDTSTLPQGNYILSVQTTTTHHHFKLIKK